jgi:hypothetical protein
MMSRISTYMAEMTTIGVTPHGLKILYESIG